MSASTDQVQAVLVNNTFLIDNLTYIDFNNNHGEKSDLFTEPFEELWKKLLGTAAYAILVIGGFFLTTFVSYEFRGQAAHYRTVLNQLNSWYLILVSFISIFLSNGPFCQYSLPLDTFKTQTLLWFAILRPNLQPNLRPNLRPNLPPKPLA